MFSAFFIRRPIFSMVISILILLAGFVSMRSLPIEQYPQIVPPIVNVLAVYPGASSSVIADTVAAPLEQKINGVDNMLYIQSTNASNGTMSMNVSFAIGTDPDQAAINVNNRVQAALSQLPAEVRQQGVIVQKKSSTILQIIALYSPDKSLDTLFMSNYALLNIVDELKRIKGVGDVVNFAGQDYAMRIWIKPDQLANLKLTTSDISQAIQDQNSQFAAGKIGAQPLNSPEPFTYTVTTQGRLSTPEEFGNIILRSNSDGSKIRLKDVARIELGAANYDFKGKLNGNPTVPLGIFLAPGANQLDVAAAVKNKILELSKKFPQGLAQTIPYDTTNFVKISIHEVVKTFVEAMILVFLVVFLFLQNWRATLIPSLAVPVSIIGTFAGMFVLGFSINTLTLFGMVLAIGIVVDDAIVVLENVERIMSTEHKSPRDATLQAMEEVSGPVVAIVLVLCAVFIPVAFLGGIAGQMYKQFAITISVSVCISGLVALTLTPALCALLLKPEHQEPNKFFKKFNEIFAKLTTKFGNGVMFFLKRSVLGMAIFVLTIVALLGLFRIVPSSLAPDEDQGYIITASILPDGASISRTDAMMNRTDKIASADHNIENVMSFAGYDLLSGTNRTNTGVTFLTLKPWEERKGAGQSSFDLVKKFMGVGMSQPDGLMFAFNPPPISGMSSTGGFEAYIQNHMGASPNELEKVAKSFVAAARQDKTLMGIQTTFSSSVPQINIQLDRDKAKALGVSVTDVFNTMQSTFGSLYVNDFNKFGRIFKVQVQSEADFRSKLDDMKNVFVRSKNDVMIPLTSLVTATSTTGPELLERFNAFPAAKIMGGPAPGFSSGDSLNAMEKIAKATLPEGYDLAWSGSAFQERSTSGSSVTIYGFAIILVFLILAAQYERWSLPISVLMAVPFAVFGALLATWLGGLANDVYLQVALVTLIGLSAKNAILIVEFAMILVDSGHTYFEAAYQSAQQRFRPIIMTSLAFILGCVPLIISTGAGAASRHSIGTGVVFGMLAATFIGTYFIPLFFVLIMSWGKGKKSNTLPDQTAHVQGGHDV